MTTFYFVMTKKVFTFHRCKEVQNNRHCRFFAQNPNNASISNTFQFGNTFSDFQYLREIYIKSYEYNQKHKQGNKPKHLFSELYCTCLARWISELARWGPQLLQHIKLIHLYTQMEKLRNHLHLRIPLAIEGCSVYLAHWHSTVEKWLRIIIFVQSLFLVLNSKWKSLQ